MKEGVVFRTARSGESGMLSELALASKAHWGYSSDFMSACKDELTIAEDDLQSHDQQYVVAEFGEQIIGFYGLLALTVDKVELIAMFVEPRHIGTGIGGQLMRNAESTASQMGATSIEIQSDPNAALFYEAAGAKVIGLKESESIPGRMLPLLKLELVSN